MRERRDPIFGRLIGGARNARDLNLHACGVEEEALDMAANAPRDRQQETQGKGAGGTLPERFSPTCWLSLPHAAGLVRTARAAGG